MTKIPQAQQKPRPRKVLVLLTDDEWRTIKHAAVAKDTSIQGYVTNLVLREIQRAERAAARTTAK